MLAVLLLCTLGLTGCDGCRRQQAADEIEPDMPLTEFSAEPPVGYPADKALSACGIKPGHWFTASQAVKANLGDRRGDLRSFLTLPVLDADGMTTGRSETSAIQSVRSVVLPKGQQRQFEFRLLAPLPDGSGQNRGVLQSRLELAGQARPFSGDDQPFELLAPQEYFFVVLTKRPERFARLKVADWLRPLSEIDSSVENNYRLVIPQDEGLLPLPETMLDLTAVAVIFWDDLPAENLTPNQVAAIQDWLHFGGRLIVNGSDAAESIRRSLLASVLPWTPLGNLELSPAESTELLKTFSVASDRSVEKQIALVSDGTARIAMEGSPHRDALPIPASGNLIARRGIGRGDVLQSRVDLLGEWLTAWNSYDSFFNGVLLGRPARKIVPSSDGFDARHRHAFAEPLAARSVSLINTGFRLASRDASIPSSRGDDEANDADTSAIQTSAIQTSGGGDEPESKGTDSWAARSFRPKAYSGIAGWSNATDIVNRSRESLRRQAGIEIPSIDLVAKSLAIYLVLLVPLNYLIFRMLGRTEYAWFVVPLIAIVGAVAVARVARLDIGFARSQNELAVLELQPDYSRGHLTRVVAIYNSLSTSYEVRFDSIHSVASPMDAPWTYDAGVAAATNSFRTSPAGGPVLTGFSVDSNRIGMLHAEQIVDLGGTIRLLRDEAPEDGGRPGTWTLINDTDADLSDAVVVRGEDDSRVSVAIVGDCPATADSRLRFGEKSGNAMGPGEDKLSASLWRALVNSWNLSPGECRLVARIEKRFPGMQITPATTQVSGETVLVAHLLYPAAALPSKDLNLITDFRRVQTELSGDGPTGEITDETIDETATGTAESP